MGKPQNINEKWHLISISLRRFEIEIEDANSEAFTPTKLGKQWKLRKREPRRLLNHVCSKW